MPTHLLAYTPATVYNHQVPQSAGAAIALVFVIAVAIGLARLFRRRSQPPSKA